MSTEEEDVTVGLWFEFLNLLLEAEARAEASPYGLRKVEDVAVDPYRIAVSDELRSGKGYLRITRRQLKEHIAGLKGVISDYDVASDS